MSIVDESPAIEGLEWSRARRYFPSQLSTYEAAAVPAMVAGMNHAARVYGLPVTYHGCVRDGFAFVAAAADSGPDSELRLRAARVAMSPDRLSISYEWRERWLPAILEHMEAMSPADLGGMPDERLAALLTDARRRGRQLWQIHFEIVFPTRVGGPRWHRSEIPGPPAREGRASFWGADGERRVLHEIGTRLTGAGLLTDPGHVLWLTPGEIAAALDRPESATGLTEQIARRRDEFEARAQEPHREDLEPLGQWRPEPSAGPGWLSAYT